MRKKALSEHTTDGGRGTDSIKNARKKLKRIKPRALEVSQNDCSPSLSIISRVVIGTRIKHYKRRKKKCSGEGIKI